MPIYKITVLKCTCLKCGHVWTARKDEVPAVCPKCKNPRWDKEPLKSKTEKLETK